MRLQHDGQSLWSVVVMRKVISAERPSVHLVAILPKDGPERRLDSFGIFANRWC